MRKAFVGPGELIPSLSVCLEVCVQPLGWLRSWGTRGSGGGHGGSPPLRGSLLGLVCGKQALLRGGRAGLRVGAG